MFVKKKEILSAVQLYLAPVLVIVLGVLLLINPDSASVLISRVLGAVLTVLGVIFGITALFSERRRVGKLITALCILMGGGILSARPLLLAAFAGRVVGLLITTAVESVTHRKINPKYEGYFHGVGMIFLLGLMAVVMFKDIFYLFR